MLFFKHMKNEGKKGQVVAMLPSNQSSKPVYCFLKTVLHVGKVSSFSHRNSCNQMRGGNKP